MMRMTFAALAIAVSAGVALAAVSGAEAIKERRALMKHDGEVTSRSSRCYGARPRSISRRCRRR